MADESLASITEEWLKSVGFKWHQLSRQPDKMWLLWLGDVTSRSYDDLGVVLTPTSPGNPAEWFCWLRADYAGNYSRFLHLRHVRYPSELIDIVEGITGQTWDSANNLYGSMRKPEHAARLREESERLDRRIAREGHAWREIEKDDTRGRALPEHLEAYEKAGLKDRNDL